MFDGLDFSLKYWKFKFELNTQLIWFHVIIKIQSNKAAKYNLQSTRKINTQRLCSKLSYQYHQFNDFQNNNKHIQ